MTADNGDGVWNTTGRVLRVTVLPAFYQTWWFVAIVATGVAGMVSMAWRHRVRQLQQLQLAQQAFSRQLIASQERDRQRIAGELHDGLGQHLLIIKNRALLGAAGGRDAASQYDEIVASAGQSLEEVREIAYNLRPYHLDRLGLTQALGAMIDKVAASSGMRLEASIDSVDDLFDKDAEITIFRIVQESLNNIVKHSHASMGTVTLARAGNEIVIAIRDDGQGFVTNGSGVSTRGGFGLVGMAERVRMLGGVCRIDSAPGEGTTVTISLAVPSSRSPGAPA